MNRLAVMAETHWKKYLPKAYAEMEDPTAFFETLATDAQAEIDARMDAMPMVQPTAGTEYSETLAEMTTARSLAESEVLREMVLLPPEDETLTADPDLTEALSAMEEFQAARDSLP